MRRAEQRGQSQVAEVGVDKTLSKGLRLVELMGSLGRTRLSDLAAETGYSKSNVHRLLQTLCRIGWVRKVAEDSTYELTFKVFEVAQNWISRFDLPRIAAPHLARLAAETGEAVHLAVLDGFDVVFVATLESPQPIRVYTPIGSRAPAHCVATGKALLAFTVPEQLPSPTSALQPFTAATKTTRDELAAEFERIRTQGYAVNKGEWQDNVNGVAAPIFAGNVWPAVASVGVSGPAARLNATATKRFIARVREAAKNISEAIAQVPDESMD